MTPKWFMRLMALFVLSLALGGCGTLRGLLVLPPLPPQVCKPSADLAAVKIVPFLPERATPNDEAFVLWLKDRAAWAKDVQDYNSLYRQCVEE